MVVHLLEVKRILSQELLLFHLCLMWIEPSRLRERQIPSSRSFPRAHCIPFLRTACICLQLLIRPAFLLIGLCVYLFRPNGERIRFVVYYDHFRGGDHEFVDELED